MSKIDIEEVEQVLLQRQVPETTAIINDLQKILEELAANQNLNMLWLSTIQMGYLTAHKPKTN
jgi:hypothetical protein